MDVMLMYSNIRRNISVFISW